MLIFTFLGKMTAKTHFSGKHTRLVVKGFTEIFQIPRVVVFHHYALSY
jgi:hypothetical protein